MFGSEKIQWDNEGTLPGSETIPSSKYRRIRPDMIGSDANGNVVIVEIKVFREEIDNNRKINNRDAIHKAVGQILNYADAYLRKGLNPDVEGISDADALARIGLRSVRLYIVVHPVASPTLENLCQLLRAHGINIIQCAV